MTRIIKNIQLDNETQTKETSAWWWFSARQNEFTCVKTK